jgi:hypothetical protein
MICNISRKFTFEFKDLQHGVPHAVTQGLNKSVVTHTVITIERFDAPQDDCDGEQTFWDYHIRGFECTQSGRVDKRQKSPSLVRFVHTRQTYKFLMGLLNSIEMRELSLDCFEYLRVLKELIAESLERLVERDQEQLKRLLS